LTLASRSRWVLVSSAVCRKVPAGPVKVPRVSRSSLVCDRGPGGAGGGRGDADEQHGRPAQDDVGADAFFLAVAGRAQVDDLLEVTPAALDLQHLLVPQRDVLAAQLGVRDAQLVLAVQVLPGLDRGGVGPLRGGQRVAAGDHLLELVILGLAVRPGTRPARPRPPSAHHQRRCRACPAAPPRPPRRTPGSAIVLADGLLVHHPRVGDLG
jgi:hypothetical protein